MKKVILFFVLSFSMIANGAVNDSTSVDNFQKTDKALSEIVKKALVVAEKTGEFAIEQAPLLLKEFYMWHITKNVLSLSMWVVFLIAIYIILKKIKNYKEEENLDMSDAEYFFPIAFSYTGVIVCVIFLFISIYDLVFILVAPKLYLIEYFIK